MTLGEHDDRSVGDADGLIGLALDDLRSAQHVGGVEGLELVRAAAHLGQQSLLRLRTDMAPEQDGRARPARMATA